MTFGKRNITVKKLIILLAALTVIVINACAQDKGGGITPEMLEGFRKAQTGTQADKALRKVFSNNNIDQLAKNLHNPLADDKNFSHSVSSKGITDQMSSGRCWLFSGLNVLRAQMIAKYNLGAFQFSQNYCFFYDQLNADTDAAREIAGRSRGTPRIANALLRRVRDFAQVKGNGHVQIDIARYALEALHIDRYGLDQIDNKILTTIIDKFKGGPVGVGTIATAIGEDPGTLEEVYEPFLIKEGFIKRTPRGREVTELAYHHLGRSLYSRDASQPTLF